MNAADVVARLRELDARSGGRRVAWGPVWREERERFGAWLDEHIPAVQRSRDAAGNEWARLPGASPETVIVGSHLDCVPEGGWLDGCLGVFAGAEILRSVAAAGTRPARTLALVDWADEEGSRFGHSLLGSSAACGLLDAAGAATLRDADGVSLPDALLGNGVDLDAMSASAAELQGAVAYLELHIEQGPVLDDAELAACAVDGCLGVRRTEFVFTGAAGHAGATPMDRRRDPLQAAARFVVGVRGAALTTGGLATIGALRTEPGTPTAIAARVRLTLDLRHRELGALDHLDSHAVALAMAAADPEHCTLERNEIWSIDPVRFDADLVARGAELTGNPTLTSGPLHDAAAVARAGVPTAMVFARTRGGVSHSRAEDARERDLVVAIDAFAALAQSVL